MLKPRVRVMLAEILIMDHLDGDDFKRYDASGIC